MIVVAPERPDQPAVAALFARADARSAALYPEDGRPGLTVSALLEAEVRFFVAREEGAAVGCGGYVRLAHDTGEVKRLFVEQRSRGRGVGAEIVSAVERAASAEGVRTLFLETGVRSDAALRLYRRLGFVGCEPFASYGPDPLSVFMVKRLVT